MAAILLQASYRWIAWIVMRTMFDASIWIGNFSKQMATRCYKSIQPYPITDSQRECVRLFRLHEKTFSLSAMMLPMQDFLDTAVLFAFFRLVRDIVDKETALTYERKNALNQIERAFYRSWESETVVSSSYPILAALIAMIVRKGYDRSAFKRFFDTMRLDTADSHLCRHRSDTEAYLDGSTTVIAECMLSLLCDLSSYSNEQRLVLLHGARSLGIAFRLTTMLRDIEMDRKLGRVYLNGVHSHDAVSIEQTMIWTTTFYQYADKSIELLPRTIQPVIQTARVMHIGIHDEIRNADYSLRKRVGVSWCKKIRLFFTVMGQAGLSIREYAQLVGNGLRNGFLTMI